VHKIMWLVVGWWLFIVGWLRHHRMASKGRLGRCGRLGQCLAALGARSPWPRDGYGAVHDFLVDTALASSGSQVEGERNPHVARLG
jgi:hypothetical protein